MEKTTGQPTKITLGKKEFTIHPMTMDDIAALRQHIRDEEIKMLNNVKNEATQIKMIEKVMSKKISEKDMDRYIGTLEGLSFILWRTSHSEVSLHEFSKLLELEGLEKATVVTKELNGGSGKK